MTKRYFIFGSWFDEERDLYDETREDFWLAFEDLEDARAQYDLLVHDGRNYSVTLVDNVLASTDFDRG